MTDKNSSLFAKLLNMCAVNAVESAIFFPPDTKSTMSCCGDIDFSSMLALTVAELSVAGAMSLTAFEFFVLVIAEFGWVTHVRSAGALTAAVT